MTTLEQIKKIELTRRDQDAILRQRKCEDKIKEAIGDALWEVDILPARQFPWDVEYHLTIMAAGHRPIYARANLEHGSVRFRVNIGIWPFKAIVFPDDFPSALLAAEKRFLRRERAGPGNVATP